MSAYEPAGKPTRQHLPIEPPQDAEGRPLTGISASDLWMQPAKPRAALGRATVDWLSAPLACHSGRDSFV